MIDLEEIDNTIKELESQKLTFDVCQKLANLHTVRQYYQTDDEVVEEYNDILPSYQKFCEVKRKYQLSEIPEKFVYEQLELLCSEVSEFLKTLYYNTDTQKERDIIEEMLKNIV